jgi:superfamily II DNA or RNA helicase
MSQKVILKIEDEVNIKFVDLDPHTRRKIVEGLKYFMPHARHTPAYKLGRWDGTVSFATVGGASYLNLLDRILPILAENGYDLERDLEIIDERPVWDFEFDEIDEFVVSERCWPKGHPAEGEPIMVRDYQVGAINTFLKNHACIQEISTGAGKTLLTAVLSLMAEKYGRSIVIVPSKSLVVQTEIDYRNMGLDVGVYYGERKELNKTHTISTWQSLAALMKKTAAGEADEYTIGEFLEGMVAVIVDEVHSAKSNDLKTLLTGPLARVPLRWGVTGTVPKDEMDKVSLKVGLGDVVGHITAAELQEKGVLSKCDINIVQLDDDHVEHSSYAEEHDYLVSDKRRMEWVAKFAQTVNADGNTLILVAKVETGHMLKALIPDSVFVYGQTKNSERFEQYDEVNTSSNKIIIATYGVAAVGINIPRIFNLVLVEPGKSFVRVIQSIGRGIRKAKDKDYVAIFDITSTLKYSTKHLSKRKSYYKDANYPYQTTKVKYLQDVDGDSLILKKKK